jgi:SAM-dependent methyltransferase
MAGRATRYTLDFVRRALPPGAQRVLEVGCGEGELAALLAADGLAVTAIDADAQSVGRAKARGVDARCAEWPDFAAGGFDAVLFTRSLHHARDLAASVAAAFEAVGRGGRLIVEDFAREEADAASLAWFRSVAPLSLRPLAEEWHERHGHDLHDAAAMEAALRRGAAELSAAGAAYYFRYLVAASPAKAVEAVFGREVEAIESGRISPLGRRWVARRGKSGPGPAAP